MKSAREYFGGVQAFMRTKNKDVKYCGVRSIRIKTADPVLDEENLQLFFRFIKNRYKARVRKDLLKKDPPFTDDPIIQKYRFTNVKREHDRESRWAIKYIYENDFISYRNKILNAILFRIFNKHETMEIVGETMSFANYKTKSYQDAMYEYHKEHPDYLFFTNVFFTSGIKLALKNLYPEVYSKRQFMPDLVLKLLDDISAIGYEKQIISANNQKTAFKKIKGIYGIGEFLAYQIFVDLTYIPDFPFSENEFTVAGPGCKKGLNYLFKDRDGMTYDECVFWLRDHWDELNDRMPKESKFDPNKLFFDCPKHDRNMNVMSIENCLCEISKYIRAYRKEGKPKRRYTPSMEEMF